MAADYPGAIWMPVPMANVFSGYWGYKPKWVVLHKTASGGSAQDVAHFFQNDPNMASSHYIIGQDGQIVQCVSETDGAGANGVLETGHATFLPTNINLNLLTISIEHVDPTSDNSTPLTAAQKDASFKLIKSICQRHSIPMRRGDVNGGIIGHSDIAPIDRSRCPGNYPWPELFDYLKGNTMQIYNEQSPGFSNWFLAESQSVWRCRQTDKTIQFGLKSLYQKLSVNGGLPIPGLPLTGELRFSVKDKEGKDVTIVAQICERAVLIYDPAHALGSQPDLADAYLGRLDDERLMKLVPGLDLAPPSPSIDLSRVTANAKTINLASAELLKDLEISG